VAARAFGPVLTNVGIAFAVVAVGVTGVAAADPETSGISLDDVAIGILLAVVLTPAYVPTVLLPLLVIAFSTYLLVLVPFGIGFAVWAFRRRARERGVSG
jgi:hypothetical protein